MKTIKFNAISLLLLLCASLSFAQTNKLAKTYPVSKEVNLSIDATHTNFKIEYWDKNEVQINASLQDSKNAKEQLQEWKLQTSGSATKVSISSHSSSSSIQNKDFENLQEPLAKLPALIGPLVQSIQPLLETLADSSTYAGLFENVSEVNFDYEAYKKEGDDYLDRWSEQVSEKMEKSAEKLDNKSKNIRTNLKMTEAQRRKFEAQMEVWGQQFGKSMQAWGEDFGKTMEAWGEQFGKNMEDSFAKGEEYLQLKNAKANKLIKLKVPKTARLNISLRYGELNLEGDTENMQANLSHSSLKAETIAGEKTNIKASYTPVAIKRWDYGVLESSYAGAEFGQVKSIKLTSKSSDVSIEAIAETALLTGSFAELQIQSLSPNFKNIEISLENSDLKLKLPEADFNFSYNAKQSEVAYPKSLQLQKLDAYGEKRLKGFRGSRNTSRNLSITANFSDVLLK